MTRHHDESIRDMLHRAYDEPSTPSFDVDARYVGLMRRIDLNDAMTPSQRTGADLPDPARRPHEPGPLAAAARLISRSITVLRSGRAHRAAAQTGADTGKALGVVNQPHWNNRCAALHAYLASLMDGLEEKVFGRLPDETAVYPGHGADTTLGKERSSIPEWRPRGW
jgi:hypothetical protein